MQGVSFTENVPCFVYVHVSDNSECHHSFFTLLFIDEYIFDLKTCDVVLHC